MPPRMTTRTASSFSASRKASSSSTSMPRFCALRVSGRSSRMRTILPSSSCSYFTNSYSGIVVSLSSAATSAAMSDHQTSRISDLRLMSI